MRRKTGLMDDVGDLSPSDPAWHGLRGRSAAMVRLRALIARAAPAAAPALLLGQSGTGKELLARALGSLGARRGQPFVALNCGALSSHLLASELFGHLRGAFTGAVADHPGAFVAAHGGTLFLDEIGDLAADAQVHLLRVLDDGAVCPVGGRRSRQVKVRIVAATHRDLWQQVARGRFRDDLFYRLDVLTVKVPSLEERRDDIAELADYFLYKDAPRSIAQRLAPAALEKLRDYPWPGNVRELRHVLWRAAILSSEATLQAADIQFHGAALPRQPVGERARPLRRLKACQQRAILAALKRHRGNRTHAAASLGVSRATLHRRLAELGLTAG